MGSRFRSLTMKVFTFNVVPLMILGGGAIYLDQYREGRIKGELSALELRSQIIAGALAEGSVLIDKSGEHAIDPPLAASMLDRLVRPSLARGLIYTTDLEKMADTQIMGNRVTQIELKQTSEDNKNAFLRAISAYNLRPRSWGRESHRKKAPITRHKALLYSALEGKLNSGYWIGERRKSSLVPRPRFKAQKVLGVVLITADIDNIAAEESRSIQHTKIISDCARDYARLFNYLASSIGQPLSRLSEAAKRVRNDPGKVRDIPDFSCRRDEIGELSMSFSKMAEDLWRRMEENEKFAADVAHEIRNPLTSLRSALETLPRLSDPGKQSHLTDIMNNDIRRIDLLIGDISEVSKIDTDLTREEMQKVTGTASS